MAGVVLNKGLLFTHPPINDQQIPPLKPIVPAPAITSLAPTSAASGQTVTITGVGFGASQNGSSYVALSDAGVNWGAPGDEANFQITSWSDTEIQFTVPEPSGPGGEWAVSPGSTASVMVAIPGLVAGTLARSAQVPLLITSAPSITGLSVSQAGPGATVVVNGQFFGAQRQSGYLTFSNNGVNWGAPGDVAPFTLVSWSDTQIVFQVPTSSGGWATTCGTQASISVTNSSGATSNPALLEVTSAVNWPISVDSGDVIVAGQGHVQTIVNIDGSGNLTAMSHIWDTSGWGFLTGFHGATIVTLFDPKGHQLDQWFGGPWGVEGGQSIQMTWTEQLNASDLRCAYSVSVINFYDPQYSAPGNILAWAEANASAITSAATTIAEAV